MAQETFEMYIARLRTCEKLSENDRNEAADQLEKWESGDVGDVDYDEYAAWLHLGILGAITWGRTSQGYDFWNRISKAGF